MNNRILISLLLLMGAGGQAESGIKAHFTFDKVFTVKSAICYDYDSQTKTSFRSCPTKASKVEIKMGKEISLTNLDISVLCINQKCYDNFAKYQVKIAPEKATWYQLACKDALACENKTKFYYGNLYQNQNIYYYEEGSGVTTERQTKEAGTIFELVP